MGVPVPTASSGRVLVVDDDHQVRAAVRRTYESRGWQVEEAPNGDDALRLLFDRRPDAVVLDVAMDGTDGWETLMRIRALSDTPVLMLSAYAAEADKVRALRSGADDYVTKPFGPQELLARTEAVMRRATAARPRDGFHDDGVVQIDFAASRAAVNGREVSLTPLEFRLLAAFVNHPGQVLDWQQLLKLAWHHEYGTREQVKVYVGYLRRKLDGAGERIETVRGFGYRYRRP